MIICNQKLVKQNLSNVFSKSKCIHILANHNSYFLMTKKNIGLSRWSIFATNGNPWFREGQPTEKGTTVSCILTDSLEFRARFVHVKGLYQQTLTKNLLFFL